MLHSISPFILCKYSAQYLGSKRILIANKRIQNFIHHVRALSSNKNDTTNNTRDIPIKMLRNTTEEELPPAKDFLNEQTTFSSDEVNKFRSLESSWWNIEGDCKPLHSLNKLRVALVRKGLVESGVCNQECIEGPQPLKGLKILDVGCGGGILCEPLARLGAEVTGLDASEESIRAAELHAQKDKNIASNVKYVFGTIEEHAHNVDFVYDAVIASEVLEHVQSVGYFVETCASLIKPGGSFFITTINRTTRSWVAAIILAEYVLGLLPRGTHNWNKYTTPKELKVYLEINNCFLTLLHGMAYIPIRNEWFWIPDSSVNYAVQAIKRKSSK